VAEEIDGDVDRAMAAFAAPPMAYHNFPPAPAASTNAAPEAKHALGTVLVEAENLTAFPLLVAALPCILQFPIPLAPNPGHAAPETSSWRGPRPKTTPIATGARALEAAPYRPMVQPADISGVGERTTGVMRSTVPVSVHRTFQHPPASATPQRHGHTTPLATMFRALHTASPSREEPTEPKFGLQNLFRHL
jgi:hypothetical protein